jgi:hypothetical protein
MILQALGPISCVLSRTVRNHPLRLGGFSFSRVLETIIETLFWLCFKPHCTKISPHPAPTKNFLKRTVRTKMMSLGRICGPGCPGLLWYVVLEPNKCQILCLTVRSEFVLGPNNGPKGSQALLVQGAAAQFGGRRHTVAPSLGHHFPKIVEIEMHPRLSSKHMESIPLAILLIIWRVGHMILLS